MRRAALRESEKAPRAITFFRTKYGAELLVDAAYVSRLDGFDRTSSPHTLDFIDLLLVTQGRGTFALDEREYEVAPGRLFISRPAEVRQWRVNDLDGACLFFAPDFTAEAFTDPRFLEQFACLRADRPSACLELSVTERRYFLSRFAEMEQEISGRAIHSAHALRALLYQLLVTMDRWYLRRYAGAAHDAVPDAVSRFRALVEQDFGRVRDVAGYARRIGLSPRQLSDSCRASLGISAKTVILQRTLLEARRLLVYTDTAVSRIGARLGFDDPAYFARLFRRTTGESPSHFRASRTRRAL